MHTHTHSKSGTKHASSALIYLTVPQYMDTHRETLANGGKVDVLKDLNHPDTGISVGVYVCREREREREA